MGADGGVTLKYISEIKKEWKSIRKNIINIVERDLKYTDKYKYNYNNTIDFLNDCKNLPTSIKWLSYDKIIDVLSIFKSCDTPVIFNSVLIIAYGDNVNYYANTLSEALNGEDIETWT